MAKIKIDGFKLYKKTDDGDVFVTDIEKTVRTKEFFRTMAIGTYGISAYRIVADVIDPSKSSVVESIKRYFDVNPFYRVIIKDTITEADKVTVKWTNETNINYIDGYEVFRVNETESGMTYELVDTITSPEATEYVFMRDDDSTYTYVISPKTYEGFHDADSSYIEVMFASIPPVMLIEPTDAVIYTARWKYDGDDGYDPDHDWEPEPDDIPKNNLLNKSFIWKSGDYNFVYMFTENGIYQGLLLNLDGTNIPYIGNVMRINFNSTAVISNGSYGTITYNDDFTQAYQDIGSGPKLIYSYDALNDTLISGNIIMSREANDYSLHKYFDAQTPNIIGTFESSNQYPDRINKFTINETEILKYTLSSDTLQETITNYTYDDYGVNCWLNDNRTTAYFNQATLLIYNPTNDSLYYVRNPYMNDYGVYTRTST